MSLTERTQKQNNAEQRDCCTTAPDKTVSKEPRKGTKLTVFVVRCGCYEVPITRRVYHNLTGTPTRANEKTSPFRKQGFFRILGCPGRLAYAAVFLPFFMPPFRSFRQTDSLLLWHNTTAHYFKLPFRLSIAQPLLAPRFNHHLLECICIFRVRLTIGHKITPHLLFSIPYCMANGEQLNACG